MEPTENISNYRLGIFYFNKTDNRFVVPKRSKSLGWTFNFAHIRTYLFLLVILAVILLAKYFITRYS